MGQYYKAYVKRENENPIVLRSWDYDNGAKLMEHSWLGNDFVNAVYILIDKEPARVGWVGDYSNEVGCDEEIYETCWSEDAINTFVTVSCNFFVENEEIVGKGFLINHSKKEFIDLKNYAIAAIDSWKMVANPLPLLTAIGNGLGGGDYHESDINYELVGYWFMDEIEYDPGDRMFPADYKNITLEAIFKEINH